MKKNSTILHRFIIILLQHLVEYYEGETILCKFYNMIIVVAEKQHKQLLETRRTQQTQIVTRGCIYNNMYLTHLYWKW